MRRLLIVLTSAVAVVASLLAAPSAQADISYAQQVVLRNDPGPYYRTYTSFKDGAKNCSDPGGCYGAWPYRTAKGKLTITPRTYKLKEGNKTYDYYVVDLSVRTSDRSGPKDWAFLEATVQDAQSVNYATYSSGKSTVSGCKTFPIDIAGGWGPLSVGTTVGSFKVNCVETWISRKAITRGQKYHLTNLNGVTSVTFQRFVRVAAGTRPSFKLSLTYPTDACGKGYASNGSTTILYHWCTNNTATWTKTIGTTG